MTSTYPPDHKFGMRVPEGGSDCSKCVYVSADSQRCRNKYFIQWNKSNKLPAPATQYCCDVFEEGE